MLERKKGEGRAELILFDLSSSSCNYVASTVYKHVLTRDYGCVCAGVGGQAKGHIQQSAREEERGADQLPLITTQTLPWHKKKAGESSHSPTFHGSLGMHIRCQERGRGVR